MRTNSPLMQARLDRGWTRPQVEAMTEYQITVPSLTRWELGYCYPQEDKRLRLAQLYGMSLEQLALDQNHVIIGVTQRVNASITEEPPIMSDYLRRELFSNLGSRLFSLVDLWPARDHRYEELQSEINHTIVDSDGCVPQDHASEYSRRQALKDMALVPVQLGAVTLINTQGKQQKTDTDLLLKYIAAGITACWYLRRGKDLMFVSEVISEYMKILIPLLISQSYAYRNAGATFLSQSFRLKGSIAEHLKGGDSATSYYQEALRYAQSAENQMEQAITNRMMSMCYKRQGKRGYKQALSYAQAAYGLMGKTTPGFLRSFVASGLSSCQAANGLTHDARISLKEARNLFDPSVRVPSMHYTESNLLAISAMVSRYHGNWQESTDLWKACLATPDIAVLGRIQGCIQYAETEVNRDDKARDRDLSVELLTEAIAGAEELNSEHYKEEARECYNLLRIVWPAEPAVKKLGREHFGETR